MRGDEQEPDKRCGILGTSGHVTIKSSIHAWSMLYKSGVYASTVTSLTLGGLSYANASRLRLIAWLREEQSPLTVWQESAEGIVGKMNREGMVEILWHRRETRRQTEKTKIYLKPLEDFIQRPERYQKV